MGTIEGLRAPQDAGAGFGESLQAGPALPSLLEAVWDMGQLPWARWVPALAFGVHPGRAVCSLCPGAAQPGSLPRGEARKCSGKWASGQSAGSLALKCWENLKKGKMFVGGRG